ncbi:MAG: putative metalloprotease yggG, partial [Pseudomonadota bacterium]
IGKFHNVDVLKGVVAHEIGHITGQHPSRQEENINNQSKISLGAVAIGIAAGILSKNPEAATAGIIGGTDVSMKNILRSSRTFEFSADQYAFSLLEKSGNSVVGMKEIFKYFQIEQRGSDVDPYLQTHPMSSERISALNTFLENSKYKTTTSSKSLQNRYFRSSYKLLAFTENIEFATKVASELSNKEVADYMKAIISMRKGDQKSALLNINKLLSDSPNNPYYNELKGQIYFEFGSKEALQWYKKAATLLPMDNLMKMNIAVVAWNVYKNTPSALMQYIHYLKEIKDTEPDSLMAYYYLSLYYEAMKEKSLAQVHLANFYHKQGSPRSKPLAKSALKGLKPETPEWYWAKDILDEGEDNGA